METDTNYANLAIQKFNMSKTSNFIDLNLSYSNEYESEIQSANYIMRNSPVKQNIENKHNFKSQEIITVDDDESIIDLNIKRKVRPSIDGDFIKYFIH